MWWRTANRADRIYCEIVSVTGAPILCDKWYAAIQACCKAAALTLLCCCRNTGIFRLIPIYTRQYTRPSQTLLKLNLKLDGNIGTDLVSAHHNHSSLQMHTCTVELHFSICADLLICGGALPSSTNPRTSTPCLVTRPSMLPLNKVRPLVKPNPCIAPVGALPSVPSAGEPCRMFLCRQASWHTQTCVCVRGGTHGVRP